MLGLEFQPKRLFRKQVMDPRLDTNNLFARRQRDFFYLYTRTYHIV